MRSGIAKVKVLKKAGVLCKNGVESKVPTDFFSIHSLSVRAVDFHYRDDDTWHVSVYGPELSASLFIN